MPERVICDVTHYSVDGILLWGLVYGEAVAGLRPRDNVPKPRLASLQGGKRTVRGRSFGGSNPKRARIE